MSSPAMEIGHGNSNGTSNGYTSRTNTNTRTRTRTHTPRDPPEVRLKRFKPGSILRVKLKNFLTYANVEFRPGPR